MTTIDWSAASTTATTDFDAAVQKAAAAIIMGVDDLLADPSAGRPAKLAVLQQLGSVLSNKEALVAFMFGQAAPKAPKALGGSPSGDPDDLQDQLDAASAKVLQLETDRAALEEALVVLGMNRLMPDAHYDGNSVRNSARSRLAEAQRAASAAPTDSVKKADVKAVLDLVPALVDAVKSPTMSNKVAGLDAVKAKVAEATRLVS